MNGQRNGRPDKQAEGQRDRQTDRQTGRRTWFTVTLLDHCYVVGVVVAMLTVVECSDKSIIIIIIINIIIIIGIISHVRILISRIRSNI